MPPSSDAEQIFERRIRAIAASLVVLGLLALTIGGLVKTLGLGPHAKSFLGPVALSVAAAGFVGLFSWAHRHNEKYGLEPAVDGGETPRWYLRTAVLAAYLYFLAVMISTGTWFGLVFVLPLGIAVAAIYRPGRLRPVRGWFSRSDSPER